MMVEPLQQDIEVQRDDALVDDPCGLLITGCPPGAPVTVVARFDAAGVRYEARARFVADVSGAVDTAQLPSVAGTYTGVDALGLFWSGRPTGPGVTGPLEPARADVRVEFAGRQVERSVRRRWAPPDAVVHEVHDDGVTGLFARPAGHGPFPALVLFGGSGGGLGPSGQWAGVLAGHGFACLAISYFGAPGLPADLVGIEVEVVQRAIAWLRNVPEVSAGPVGVMGISRGSELALLAGVHLEGVGAVVGLSPSGVVWSGLGARGPVDAPAWTYRGAPVPYARPSAELLRPLPGEPFALRPLFDRVLADDAQISRAEIAVERIDAPVLLVSGADDAMWPSVAMAEIAVRRAAARGARPIRHLRYEGAGHTGVGVPGVPTALAVPGHPLDGGHYAFGGSYAANAAARADSWPRIVAFLSAALEQG